MMMYYVLKAQNATPSFPLPYSFGIPRDPLGIRKILGHHLSYKRITDCIFTC